MYMENTDRTLYGISRNHTRQDLILIGTVELFYISIDTNYWKNGLLK